MSYFENKVIAITGAGSGIGRALALGAAARGARLAICDIDEVALAQTAQLLASDDVHQQPVDVSDVEAVEAFAAGVADRFGVVHQIYNNAGISRTRSTLALTYADYERVLGVNLWGVIHGTKAFLPHLIASGAGHVVNVSSLNGYMAYPGLSAYVTSKFAVRGFTEALRIEMLQAGAPVRVTVVHPGGVKTNLPANARAWNAVDGIERDAAAEARAAAYEARYLRKSPESAAKIILDGAAAGKSRILVGRDAKAIDKVVRLLPAVYPRIVARFTAPKESR